MRKLCILLTDPMRVFYEKGEIKLGYYNPCNYFDEIHMISFCSKDIEEEKIKIVTGGAKLKVYSIGKLSLFSLLILRNRLLNLVRIIKPDVIRAYDPSLRGAFTVYIGKKLNLPTVISVHNHLNEQRKFDGRFILKIRKLFECYSLKHVTKVICVTNYVKTYADKFGAKDITVIYNRIRPEQFYPQMNKIQGSDKRKILLSVGRLDKQKYQECLIRAIKDLDVKLILIGNGANYNYLKKLCYRLNLNSKVEFIKSVSNSEIKNYYHKSDIFTIASYYEGFCIPVLEAMATGIPVVASDIPSIREIGQGAVRLVKNNPKSFREAFLEIIGNENRRKEMSLRGLEVVKGKFNYHRLENLEKALYQSLINN